MWGTLEGNAQLQTLILESWSRPEETVFIYQQRERLKKKSGYETRNNGRNKRPNKQINPATITTTNQIITILQSTQASTSTRGGGAALLFPPGSAFFMSRVYRKALFSSLQLDHTELLDLRTRYRLLSLLLISAILVLFVCVCGGGAPNGSAGFLGSSRWFHKICSSLSFKDGANVSPPNATQKVFLWS